MEKFREIEIDLQNKINEIIGIDTLFDDYVKDRNEYDKELFNSLLNNNAKLSNKINKAIEYITKIIELNNGALSNREELILSKHDLIKNETDVLNCLIKILKGEDNE